MIGTSFGFGVYRFEVVFRDLGLAYPSIGNCLMSFPVKLFCSFIVYYAITLKDVVSYVKSSHIKKVIKKM